MAATSIRVLPAAVALAGLAVGLISAPDRARALSIELKDVAADRVDRQRSFADGALPLPGTPNVAVLADRLKEKGVTLSAPMLIRIFKTESEMEIWKEKDGAFVLFASYPICHWSGSLGPKLRQGDKQAPEGFYTVGKKQLRHVGRWPRSLHLNFPNVYDQAEARTGSDILIHGGCTSVGCFAMTNPVSDEIHRLTTAAIDAGQEHVPIHVFPFRMTDDNLTSHPSPAWGSFWANLKEGYDFFEKTKRAPRVSACAGRYTFSDAPGLANSGTLDACDTTIATIQDQKDWLNGLSAQAPISQPVRTAAAEIEPMHLGAGSVTDATPGAVSAGAAGVPRPAQAGERQAMLSETETVQAAKPETPAVRCRYALRSCRKTASLAAIQAARRAIQFSSGLRQHMSAARMAGQASKSNDPAR